LKSLPTTAFVQKSARPLLINSFQKEKVLNAKLNKKKELQEAKALANQKSRKTFSRSKKRRWQK
jgi:phosphoribosyl-AMP cyclohydrolase